MNAGRQEVGQFAAARRTAFALMLAGVLLPGAAGAKLVFDQPVQTVQSTWSDTEAVAVYKFKNTGPETVKITDVEPSCGCTVPSMAKDTYAPGEEGEITLKFAFGGRSGQAREIATVTTDPPQQPPVVLTIQTFIPKSMDVDPQVVYWKAGDQPDPKTVVMTLAPDMPVEKVEASATGNDFKILLKAGSATEPYQLVITPVFPSPAAKAPPASAPTIRSQITLTLTLSGGHTRTTTVYAYIFPGAAAFVSGK